MAARKTQSTKRSRADISRPRSSATSRSADSLASELVVVRDELRRVDQRHAALTRRHSYMRNVVVVTALVLLLYAALLYSAARSDREGRA